MNPHPLNAVLSHLRRATRHEADATSDGQLLARFLNHRDENAFELLVWRHARLVLGVCRRILDREADAEDAFQATFLVLVQQARSLRRGDSLASWLARVAYRVALRLRTTQPSGPDLTGIDPPAPEGDPSVDAAWREVRLLLDHELDLLPEKYRVPLVLCHLEGKTHDEAAKEMGCPRGTVAVRLMRGRELLRGRLLRRGVALSAGLLAAGGAAKVSAALVNETVKAGMLFATAGSLSTATVALAKGVLRSMFVNKLKSTVAGVLLTATVLTGLGLGLQSQLTIHAEPPKDPPPPKVADRDTPADPPPPAKESPPPWKGLLGDHAAAALEFEMKQGNQPYKGTIQYLKPDHVAIKVRRGIEETVEHLIVAGDTTTMLMPQRKMAVRTHSPDGEMPVTFALFALNPEEAWKRFEITTAKQDQHYHYLNLLPRTDKDKKLVLRARLVVNRETLLPRQLWVELPGSEAVTWEVVHAAKDLPLTAEHFKVPDLTGWQVINRPEDPAATPAPSKGTGPLKVETTGGQVSVRCDLFEATADRFIQDGADFQFTGKVRLSARAKAGESPMLVSAEKVVVRIEDGRLKLVEAVTAPR